MNTIRDACEWFGIIVDTDEGQKLFARREPGALQATGDMYTLQAKTIAIPERIRGKNTNSDAVKRSLDQLAVLTTLEFDIEGLEGKLRDRPSFRDLTSFTFQPQNVIANPNILFYKTDTIEHREKLRTIFPYVLGAVSSTVLAKRHELKQLRRELRRKQQELATVQHISERWRAEALARVTEARELGLVPHASPLPKNHADAITLLRDLAASSRHRPNVTTDTVAEAVTELAALQEEEGSVSQDLSRLRRRYAEMVQLKSTATQYRAALAVQQDRLQVSAWLRAHEGHDHACPICGNLLNGAQAKLDELLGALQRVEETTTQFGTVPASFDREFERVRAEITEITERLRGIRIRQAALERRDSAPPTRPRATSLGGAADRHGRGHAVGCRTTCRDAVNLWHRRYERASCTGHARLGVGLVFAVENLGGARPDDHRYGRHVAHEPAHPAANSRHGSQRVCAPSIWRTVLPAAATRHRTHGNELGTGPISAVAAHPQSTLPRHREHHRYHRQTARVSADQHRREDRRRGSVDGNRG